MRKLFGLIFVFSSLYSLAQGSIEFLALAHDFGTIKEADGEVAHTFFFTNTGDTTIAITEVKPSCGCTTSYWTESLLSPGDTGIVVANFNPSNRPGKFYKTLKVSSLNDDFILTIQGYVTPVPTSAEEAYPVDFGAIRLDSDLVNFGRVTNEKSHEIILGHYKYLDQN